MTVGKLVTMTSGRHDGRLQWQRPNTIYELHCWAVVALVVHLPAILRQARLNLRSLPTIQRSNGACGHMVLCCARDDTCCGRGFGQS